MTARGILFSRSMVIALKNGGKTQTRRIITPQPPLDARDLSPAPGSPDRWVYLTGRSDTYAGQRLCPYGGPGQRLYCKETVMPVLRSGGTPVYAADWPVAEVEKYGLSRGGWKPSIMMSRAEARIWLRVTEVRAQRLREITEADAQAEGVLPDGAGSYVAHYAALWNEINAGFKAVKGRRGGRWVITHFVSFPWAGERKTVQHKDLPGYIVPNPYVYAVTFEQVRPETHAAQPLKGTDPSDRASAESLSQ